MAVQIQIRRGTAAQWTAANPVLAQGEMGLETDTGKVKFGDGVTAWNSLAYFTVTGIDHGTLVGLGDDDHPQYALDADLTNHAAAADPHTGYRLESADHSHQSAGLQGGQLDHGLALTGLTDDDHPQYRLESESGTFTIGATVLSPTTGTTLMAWRAPFACTVTNVRCHFKGGTSVVYNARKNQLSNHLSVDQTASTANAWADGGAVQNTAYAAGDDLELMFVTINGAVTEATIQVDFTRP